MTLDFKYPEKFNEFLEVVDANLNKPKEEDYVKYYDVNGGRASAKSHGMVQFLIERSLEENCLILCGREIQGSIADSSKKLIENKIIEHGLEHLFNITEKAIKCITGSEFIFKGFYRNEQSIRSTEGIKYAWVEEAQAVTIASLKALDPTIREDGCMLFFTYNPLEEPDAVHTFLADKLGRSYSLKINYWDNPFCPRNILIEAEACKVRDYDEWLHVWAGQPMIQGETSIINRVELMKAVERKINPEGREEVGVDVARFGDDRTQFYKRKGLKIVDSATYKKQSVVETCDRLVDFVDYSKEIPLKIDDTGIGGGVTDIMKSRGYYVVPVNNGEKAMEPDRYPNAISEMWFNIRDLLPEMEIPDDSELHQELTRRKYAYDSKGRRCVESKKEYKKRYSSSPDKADAFLLAYYEKNFDYINALASW
jgi:phage terminase large subunit